ncbi:uncharacterized protein DSM5745_06197 [Aspergillus mulundensis]|uniref:Uncharacterized protein n=1 Tax=Aspergillus mulundensis TaxID=1810919 RepID=A0A3D8RZ84_9EURO|nr:Uncharacterized protein DSM5745_06197 [Aspergillus mulundensis]RDW79345.1 Uncharacterized protein DSM5745_06197 [Aspergillus mulundensis]
MEESEQENNKTTRPQLFTQSLLVLPVCHYPPKSDSILPNRFFRLPVELRLQIYRILLVRPCKFDLHHQFGCHVGIIGLFRPGPIAQLATSKTFRCAECNIHNWRSQDPDLTSDTPASSQWGRPKRNPYLCDICYPELQYRLGLEKCPSMKGLECLCARRQNLAILLTSRQIYQEAWPVFWTENTFAFESGRLLAEFMEAVGAQKRAAIRFVSLLAPKNNPLQDDELPECWLQLRECTGLRELELDASILESFEAVVELTTIKTREIRFMQKSKDWGFDSYGQAYRERKIIRSLAYRREYTDSLPDILELCMTRGSANDKDSLRRAFDE